MDLSKITTSQIKKSLLKGKFSAVELVDTYLNQIYLCDPKLKAFITITNKEAKNSAKLIDKKIKNKEKLGGLAGTILAVKDIFLTRGIQTTSSSKVLKGYIPQYSSTVYQRLIDQDAIIIGKTNTDTFAFGASTENSGFFTTKNPWNTEMVPGGSSGGSAVAVAANMATIALGTDTGGSIRQPASLCGISGLKPTYGRNSRHGITAMASSFDSPGILGRHVEDLAIATQYSAGQDPLDATSSFTPVPNLYSLLDSTNLKGLKIGLPKEYFEGSIQKEVKDKVLAAVKLFESKGAKIINVSLPSTDLGIAVYYVLVPCEISANMARYDGIRFGQSRQEVTDLLSYYLESRGDYMEDELKRRIIIGTYALSAGYYDAYYTKASQVRNLIRKEFLDVLKQVDVIMAPVSPTTAWPIGQKANNPLEMYLADVYTVCINVAGLPSLSLPCGFDCNKLPIGFQIISNFFEEAKILSIGHQYQQFTDYHLAVPPLCQ